jgi:hypothetical protein
MGGMEERRHTHTLSGNPPQDGHWDASAPAPIDPTSKQHRDHWVLSPEERAKGFIRPVRVSYKHTKCGTITTMPKAIAETYAAKPGYYGQTFCCQCRTYLPVGEHGEFEWLDDHTKVGT